MIAILVIKAYIEASVNTRSSPISSRELGQID